MLIKYKKNYYLFAYIFVYAIEFLSLNIQNRTLELASKPFLIAIIFVMYIHLAKVKNYYYIVTLLLLSFVDFALIYRDDTNYLLLAIIALIITHFLYIKILYTKLIRISAFRFIRYLSPFLLCLLVIFWVSKNYLDSLSNLILVHLFLLFFVTNIIFMDYLQRPKKNSLLLLLGFFTLIFSNFFFGFNIFLDMGIYALIISNILYFVAQFIICQAMIDESN